MNIIKKLNQYDLISVEIIVKKPITRSSNIELLRIISMLGVIILHYNNSNIGGGFKYVESNSINYWILLFLEALNICAVNLFILISGFFLCESDKRKASKVIDLVSQVVIFKALMYVIRITLSTEGFSVKSMVTSALFDNYFVVLYLVLYLISPYFNIIINSINVKEYQKLLGLLVSIFSIWAIAIDILMQLRGGAISGISTISNNGNGYGYTIVQFSLMYFIGGYIRKNWDGLKTISKYKLIFLLLVNTSILTAWGYLAEPTAFEYCNPLIITEAVIVFILFNRIDIGYSKIINILASEAFSVFLFHDILIRHVGIEQYVNKSAIVMCGHIVFCVLLIYLVCFMCGFGYHWIIRLIKKGSTYFGK